MISNPMNLILLYPFSNLVSIYFEQQSKDGISYNLGLNNLLVEYRSTPFEAISKINLLLHTWIIRRNSATYYKFY